MFCVLYFQLVKWVDLQLVGPKLTAITGTVPTLILDAVDKKKKSWSGGFLLFHMYTSLQCMELYFRTRNSIVTSAVAFYGFPQSHPPS
jgi:hypothetical protein